MKFVMVTSSKNLDKYYKAIPDLIVIKKSKNLIKYLAELNDNIVLLQYGITLCRRFLYRVTENISYYGEENVINLFNFTTMKKLEKPLGAKYLKEIIALYIPKMVLKNTHETTSVKLTPVKRIVRHLLDMKQCIYTVSPSLVQTKTKPSIWFIDDIRHPFNLIFFESLLPYHYEFTSTTYLLSKIKGKVSKEDYHLFKDRLLDLKLPPPPPTLANKAILKAVRSMNCPTTPILVQKK